MAVMYSFSYFQPRVFGNPGQFYLSHLILIFFGGSGHLFTSNAKHRSFEKKLWFFFVFLANLLDFFS